MMSKQPVEINEQIKKAFEVLASSHFDTREDAWRRTEADYWPPGTSAAVRSLTC
jgi:hypothetical protein